MYSACSDEYVRIKVPSKLSFCHSLHYLSGKIVVPFNKRDVMAEKLKQELITGLDLPIDPATSTRSYYQRLTESTATVKLSLDTKEYKNEIIKSMDSFLLPITIEYISQQIGIRIEILDDKSRVIFRSKG